MASITKPSFGENPLPGSVPLPPLLRIFQLWTVLLFAISLCFHLFNRLVRHLHGFLGNPLSIKAERFSDFTIFYDKFAYFHRPEFWHVGFPINYPAPVELFFEFFFRFMAPHALLAFVIFSILSFTVPSALFAKALSRRGIRVGTAYPFVTICCFLSWPFVLIVDRGNAEVAVWLAMLIGMWAYATGREWVAAIFFGIAASMKLFPFVFLALFLSRRQLWNLVLGATTFFGVSIVSLKVLGPTIMAAYRGIAFGLASFKRNYMAEWHTSENGVDHSIFSTFKLLLLLIFHHSTDDFTGWLRVYLATTSIGGILLYLLVIRKLPLLNQVLTLAIACIYFTPFSGDGTLVHLYYPLAMLMLLAIQAHQDGVTIRGLAIVIYCMVVCLSLETFLTLNITGQGMRLIGPAHCVALGVMMVTALRYPLGPPLQETPNPVVLSAPVTYWAGE